MHVKLTLFSFLLCSISSFQICLPVLRRYLVNEWTVKDIAETLSCSSLLKHVKGIFLKESFITLVEMTVLPKIATTVKYWNPTVDRTPIHEWVLPWVRVIGRSISTVFPGTTHTERERDEEGRKE